jgi:hypothetical protein
VDGGATLAAAIHPAGAQRARRRMGRTADGTMIVGKADQERGMRGVRAR